MNNKPRLLILSQVFPNKEFPQNGTFIIERVKRLSAHYDITIISPQPWAPSFWPFNKINGNWNKLNRITHEDTFNNLTTYYPKYFTLPKQLILFLEGWLYFNKIKKLIKKINPDLIHAHFALPDGHAAYYANIKYKIPYLLTAHGSDINIYPQKKFCKNKIIKILDKASSVISVSENLKKKIDNLLPGKEVLLSANGYDPKIFKPNTNPAINENLPKKFILFVGNMLPIKGVDTLLESIPLQKNNLPLVLVGKGKTRWLDKFLEKISDSKVIFLGPKYHTEVAKIMQQASLLVLPSQNEGLPTVLIENMAVGNPVVASNVGGIPEIINDKNGILVESGNSTNLAFAIDEALKKEWDSEYISNQASKYTWDNIVRKEIKIYQELI